MSQISHKTKDLEIFPMSPSSILQTEPSDLLFDYALNPGLGELHCKFDSISGLKAIVAIHSLNQGSALGGCRFVEYPSTEAALTDVKRLAQGMSYKSAMFSLPYGGAKAVIIKPPQLNDKTPLLEAFGRFVNDLKGRYITTIDSGTCLADLAHIAMHTSFVTSHRIDNPHLNPDPSPYTALGVYRGIEATLDFHLQKSVSDSHVVIQGTGNVGYYLAQHLHRAGAKISVYDTHPNLVQRCVEEFNATAIAAEDVYRLDCDVFSPCALGGILNEHNISQLATHIIAGCANNQLATSEDGIRLHQRGILYAPDYVINAGGLIFAAQHYSGIQSYDAQQKIDSIYTTLMDIFKQAQQQALATSVVADMMAAQRLHEQYQC